MKRRIIADSSCDIFEMEGIDFVSVPLTISTDERSFVDDKALDVDGMLTYLACYEGRSYTACPNMEAWLQAYQGADEIFVVTLSSNVSGTYAAAVSAAALYTEENPSAKIRVFDTLSAGPEVQMLAQKLGQYLQQEKPFEEICQLAEAYMKKTAIYFCLQSFHNFAENGRVNKAVAKIGGMLGIRIMATASDGGTIEITDKCRGDKGTLKLFLEKLKNAGYRGGEIYLAHCHNESFAQLISDAVRQLYENAKVKIYETRGLCSFYAEKGGILLGFERA